MKFYSSYSPPDVVSVPSGERIQPVYKLVKDDETGKSQLVEIDKTNIYDAIQSYAQSCDLTTRLAMFANGDKNALTGGRGVYADLTGVPKSYIDAQQQAINADRMFNNLPDDIRNLFGSFSNFRDEFARGTVDMKINQHLARVANTQEVKKEEAQSE